MKNKKAFAPTSLKLRMVKPALPAFTIIELLVVIVVIGILATITIVSYNGITNKAIASSLQSDLANASKQLDLFQVDYGYHPSTIDCTIPDSVTNKCIKTNPANSFTYLPGLGANPTTYTLTATHTSTNTNYTITPNSSPIATAPENPVADWLAMPRGDHYGNFYDLVSKQYATVTRSTPKTIYDSITNRIYDVPPNTLGIRPRSDGKAGYEAEVEESRTNYLLNSSGSYGSNWSCSGSDGSYCNYNSAMAPDGTNSATTMNISGSAHYYRQIVSVYPSTTYTFSFYAKNINVSNINYCIYDATNALNIIAPTSYISQINDKTWTRISITFTTSSNTTSIGVYPERDASTNGAIYFWGMQLERGKMSTSYIPTTSSSINRAADVVTVSTDNWAVASGSIISFLSLRNWGDGLIHGIIATGDVGVANSMTIDKNAPNQSRMIIYDNNSVYSAPAVSSSGSGYKYLIGRWSNDEVSILQEGSSKVSGIGKTPNFHPAEAVLGNRGGYWNDSMHRITIYDRFLSDSKSIDAANAIKDGF